MAKRHKNRRANKPSGVAAVLRNLQKDATAAANSMRRRVYHNARGLTSDAILAAMGPAAADLLSKHLDGSDALGGALGTALATPPTTPAAPTQTAATGT